MLSSRPSLDSPEWVRNQGGAALLLGSLAKRLFPGSQQTPIASLARVGVSWLADLNTAVVDARLVDLPVKLG